MSSLKKMLKSEAVAQLGILFGRGQSLTLPDLKL